jgi:hypothetical protein
MTERKFTPGPWIVGAYGVVRDKNKEVIVTHGFALSAGYRNDGVPEANGRLMASSPRLLAVLQRYVKYQSSSVENITEEECSIIHEAEAAIAEATNTENKE